MIFVALFKGFWTHYIRMVSSCKKTVSYENLPKPNKKKQLKKRLKRKKSNHQG